LHTLSLAAASQTQNARASGTAKELDQAPLKVLLKSYQSCLVDALENWVYKVQVIRGETELPVKVSGLSAQSITATMEDVKKVIDPQPVEETIASSDDAKPQDEGVK
jgi:hypothetical protein